MFAAGWKHTESQQLSQCSAAIKNHLPEASQPHEGKNYPHFADGEMEAQEQQTTKKQINKQTKSQKKQQTTNRQQKKPN